MTGLDLDIVSRTVGINALVAVYCIANDLGIRKLADILDIVNGVNPAHLRRATKLYEVGKQVGLQK